MEHLTTWAIGVIIFSWFSFYYFWKDELRKYPGPRLAAMTDLFSIWIEWKTRNDEHPLSLHERYGDVVRVAPRKLLFSSDEAVKDIFDVSRDLRKV